MSLPSDFLPASARPGHLSTYQTMLDRLHPLARKPSIMRWWENGWINGDEAQLLIASNNLEAA